MTNMAKEKIKTVSQLDQLSEQLRSSAEKIKTRVLICSTGCRALGSVAIAEKFREVVSQRGLDGQTAVVEVGCIGYCSLAPLILIEPYDFLYGRIKVGDVEEIVTETVENGKVVERLCVKQDGQVASKIDKVNFYSKQERFVLERCGRIDPKRIEEAISRGAYLAALTAVTEKEPDGIIEEVIESGLRGRGGAGFLTGLKWKYSRGSEGDEKYLICNADEGDPGAFMDRALLEGDPHCVIEGMIIAAYAIGASQGFIYVRAEYPIAVEHINIAIFQARELGFLG